MPFSARLSCMARCTSEPRTPGRSSASPAATASRTASWLRSAASGASPTTNVVPVSENQPSSRQPQST